MPDRQVNQKYDVVVVGGGAAGCVLASRLSEQPLSVLLIEAGPDIRPGNEPEHVIDAGFRAHFDPALFTPFYPVTYAPGIGGGGPRAGFYRQPQVLGGGSTVNGMHAQRGTPDDFDSWRNLGVEGWDWADVLPWFIRCETDLDCSGDEHGQHGLIPISRIARDRWSRLSDGIGKALEKHGIPWSDDLNHSSVGDCVGPVPLNNAGDCRVSVAMAYLERSVRARSNLRVVTGAHVERIVFDGTRAIGVEFWHQGQRQRVMAGETIISAGALRSPAVLLRSGVGPADHLHTCNIDVIADRPGVGSGLRNHLHFSLTLHLRRTGRVRGDHRAPDTMVARYTSRYEGCEPTDMAINLWERLPGSLRSDPLGRQMAFLMLLVNKTYSRGTVRLDPSNINGDPQIDFNILSDPRDLDRMLEGLEFLDEILRDKVVASLFDHAFVALPGRLMAWLTGYDLRAKAVSLAGALALALTTPLTRFILRRMGPSFGDLLRDREALRKAVLQYAQPASHATSSCRMGALGDPLAVTDSHCRVIGTQNLRVVDGSIFPAPVRAGTHLPIIMVAERAAALIAKDLADQSTEDFLAA